MSRNKEFDISKLAPKGEVGKYPYQFELPVGTRLSIGGIPFEYLGDGKVGGGTNPEHIYEPHVVFPQDKPSFMHHTNDGLLKVVQLQDDTPPTPSCGVDRASPSSN